jgi:hypothetical protein
LAGYRTIKTFNYGKKNYTAWPGFTTPAFKSATGA